VCVCVTLREEHRLRMFENRVLKRTWNYVTENRALKRTFGTG